MHYLIFLTLYECSQSLSSTRVLVLTRLCGICTESLRPLEGVTDSKVHPLHLAVQDSNATDIHRHNILCQLTQKTQTEKAFFG